MLDTDSDDGRDDGRDDGDALSYGDLRRQESVSPPFIPPSAIRAVYRRWHWRSGLPNFNPYPLPAFLCPPHHLQRGQDARWQPLRNSLHAQGRQV
jgi:hypothetical protein